MPLTNGQRHSLPFTHRPNNQSLTACHPKRVWFLLSLLISLWLWLSVWGQWQGSGLAAEAELRAVADSRRSAQNVLTVLQSLQSQYEPQLLKAALRSAAAAAYAPPAASTVGTLTAEVQAAALLLKRLRVDAVSCEPDLSLPNPPSLRVFFAANFRDSASVLPQIIYQLVQASGASTVLDCVWGSTYTKANRSAGHFNNANRTCFCFSL